MLFFSNDLHYQILQMKNNDTLFMKIILMTTVTAIFLNDYQFLFANFFLLEPKVLILDADLQKQWRWFFRQKVSP